MSAVPRFTTALSGLPLGLERQLLDKSVAIEHWLRSQWLEHTPPFYGSVGLRNSGFKLAPVDTNLYPGGFNNLNPDFHALCVQAAQTAVEKICPDARDALLIPENHTRNQFYLQNVATLARILRHAGRPVRRDGRTKREASAGVQYFHPSAYLRLSVPPAAAAAGAAALFSEQVDGSRVEMPARRHRGFLSGAIAWRYPRKLIGRFPLPLRERGRVRGAFVLG